VAFIFLLFEQPKETTRLTANSAHAALRIQTS